MTTPVAQLDSAQPDPGAGPQMLQRLGLFSATTIVVGSMIGSGIFIVDSDIARLTDSPALFLAAWLVTGTMTMICALSYGELAAMMPKAGGQYVYLRESLGPLWGFLYGWTLFLVIQTGTIAAVCVAFGKFLGVFFPAVSSTHWLWHIAHVPAIRVGPMVLGNMEIGVSTANLAGIAVVAFVAAVNIRGVEFGAGLQNVFTVAKALALAGLFCSGFQSGEAARRSRLTSALIGASSGATPAGTRFILYRWARRGLSPWSAPLWSWRSFKWALFFPAMPGTTSPSPRAKSRTPGATFRFRSRSAWASSSSPISWPARHT